MPEDDPTPQEDDLEALARMQERFAQAVRGAGPLESAFALIQEAGIAPADRMAVYRNNFIGSLLEVLAGTFPVVKMIVGERFFPRLVADFIQAHPPTEAVLAQYGGQLPPFLQAYEPVSKLGYLPDVAALEWARQRAYFAADSAPLEPEALGAVLGTDPGGLIFTPLPATTVIASDYPLGTLWEAHQVDDPANVRLPDKLAREAVVVTRPQRLVLHSIISRDDGLFLRDLCAGLSLGETLDAAQKQDRVPADLQALLALSIQVGVFGTVRGG